MIGLTILANEELVRIATIIFITFLGSCAKDYIILLSKNIKIDIGRIFFSTITGSIIIYFASPIIISYLSFRGLILASFIAGITGFELLKNLSTSPTSAIKVLMKLIFGYSPKSPTDSLSDLLKGDDDSGKQIKIIITKNSDDDDRPKDKK